MDLLHSEVEDAFSATGGLTRERHDEQVECRIATGGQDAVDDLRELLSGQRPPLGSPSSRSGEAGRKIFVDQAGLQSAREHETCGVDEALLSPVAVLRLP